MFVLRPVLVLVLAGLLAACGKGTPADGAGAPKSGEAAKAAQVAAGKPLLLSAEDVREVSLTTQSSGPVITGSIQPERRADLRAEVSAVVLQVLKENGETVRAGDLLVRLDDTAIRDSLASAEESERTTARALEQAERQLQRQKTLQAQGMSSMQALDDAEVRRNAMQSDLVAARSRVVAARQTLRRTEVRAPFDGVVSERRVSAGDTAQVGKELLKVIDPASMRFEGLVSADRLSEVRVGQAVSFRINGFPQTDFVGKVKRVDAAANATTRQIEVLVAFASGTAPRVAGLYAEGRIETGETQALTVPEAALLRAGDAAFVWRVAQGSVTKLPVVLGERDARRGDFPVLQGLTAGDRILRNPGSTLVDGQAIEWARPVAAAAVPSAALASAAAPASAAVASAARGG
jgi:membrane fusion protein, multidrug efflux system